MRADPRWAALLAAALPPVPAHAQGLPAGGETTWEIRNIKEVVTFALFDPASKGIELPPGLAFIPAKAVPDAREHLERHPEHSDWAFSVVEIAWQEHFVIDGRSPRMPEHGAVGLWLAPVDASGLEGKVDADKFTTLIGNADGCVLTLGVWVPDRDYVAYMREKGHHAEFALVTLTEAPADAWRGEITVGDSRIAASARPRGEARKDPGSGTQVLFPPGPLVSRAAILAGAGGTHRECDGEWTREGTHPLAKAIFFGPTYMTTYDAPLRGSVYRLAAPEGQP